MKPVPVGLAAAILVFAAGCVSGGAPSSATAPTGPAVSDETGALSISATDEELRAVAGAIVGIPALKVQGTTNEAGHVLLGGLPPGTHDLFANAFGYESLQSKVDVVAGTTVEKTLAFRAISIATPHFEPIPYSGRFECAYTAIDLQWRTCDETGTVWPASDNSERFVKPPGVTQIVAELRWQPASGGTGQNLDFSVMEGKPDREGCQWFANDYGPSPQRLVVTVDEKYENSHSAAATGCGDDVINDKDKDLMVKIHSSPAYVQGQATFGVTYGQKYDGYVTLFYAMQAPDAYTALSDN